MHLDSAIFNGQFYRPGHKWRLYKAFASEFPGPEELKTLKGIIFPGAYFSVYQDLPWIAELQAFIRRAFHEHPHVKLVGICFGH